MGHYTLLMSLIFYVLISCATSCERCDHQSRATYFSSNSSLTAGACRYKSLAFSFNGGYVAAASSSVFRGGVACGACFQIRCKNTKLCSSGGVKVVLTDLSRKFNDTDFVLSSKAFMGMAKKGLAKGIKKLGIVDVEYKRIPCEYKGKNLSVRVEEGSKQPNYLAIKMLYQEGQTDIVEVDVAQVGSSNWHSMFRDYGPVWSTNRTPLGPLQFRMVVQSGFDGKWVWAQGNVLPIDWKIGSIYDSEVQIDDIAQEVCRVCDDKEWE